MEESSIATPMRLIKASLKTNQKFTDENKLYFQALTSSQK